MQVKATMHSKSIPGFKAPLIVRKLKLFQSFKLLHTAFQKKTVSKMCVYTAVSDYWASFGSG